MVWSILVFGCICYCEATIMHREEVNSMEISDNEDEGFVVHWRVPRLSSVPTQAFVPLAVKLITRKLWESALSSAEIQRATEGDRLDVWPLHSKELKENVIYGLTERKRHQSTAAEELTFCVIERIESSLHLLFSSSHGITLRAGLHC